MEILRLGLGSSTETTNLHNSHYDLFCLCEVIHLFEDLIIQIRILLCKINLSFKKHRSLRLSLLRLITKMMTRLVLLVNGFFWIRKKIIHLDLDNNPILRPATERASTIVCNHLACYVWLILNKFLSIGYNVRTLPGSAILHFEGWC